MTAVAGDNAVPAMAGEQDPLLGCLLLLARQHGIAASANTLTAGLPLVEGVLTPQLFNRAARRIGLAARVVKRPLAAFSALHTPAVLLLAKGRACVLLKPLHARQARVQTPDNPDGEQQISARDLGADYSGYAILVSLRHRYDARTPEPSVAPQGNWFWQPVFASWRIYRDVLVASALINLFALVSPLFIMNVYDRVVPNQALETLWVLAAGALTVFCFDFLLRGLRGYFIDLAGRKTDLEVSARIYAQVLGLRMESRPVSTGAFANNLREFEGIRDFFASLTLTAFVDLPFVVIFLLAVWLLAGSLVWVPLTAIPILIGYGLLIQPRLRRSAENGMRAAAQKNASLVEGLLEAEAVKTLTLEGRLQRQLEGAVADGARWGAQTRLLTLSATNLAIFLQQLVLVGVVIAGVYAIKNGELSLGALIAAVILSGRSMAPLAQVAGLLARFNQSSAALQTLAEIMRLPVERPRGKTFLTRPELEGNVDFDRVTFAYPEQAAVALDQVSFKIASGERVAIIGRIGSGKTTINRLIVRLYQAQTGAVLVDGVDIRQIDPGDLRRNIGYVSQDGQLLFGSVRENLAMGVPHADDAAIVRAAEISGVADFVNRHPQGFDMPVGEHGCFLSGGQRQAVALARTLVLNPPLFLLDEPTGAMDNRSEERVKQRLSEVIQDKTLVLITHRAPLLDLVERVIVLDQGKVVADGPKTQVLDALRAGRIRQSG